MHRRGKVMSSQNEGDIRALDYYPYRVRDNIRQADTDLQGHVNNAIIATYFEIGRIDMFGAGRASLIEAGHNVVLRKISIEYLAELHYPGYVEIGSRGVRLGNTSFAVAQALFKDGECVATAEAVCVLIGRQSRRPQPMPGKLRDKLSLDWKLHGG
jgi:acyl-CoA thioester hydrolase